MKRLLVFLLLLSSAQFAGAQTDVFTWEEGMTKYNGTFDPKIQSKENLGRIYDYLVEAPANIFEVATVWTINQMDSTFLNPLDSVFRLNKAMLNSIVLPEGAFWKDLKAKRMTELEQFYFAKRLEILSYTNPSILDNEKYSYCSKYAHALNGTEEELLSAWKTLHEEQKKKNSSPETLEARYLSELSSENNLLYAKLNVTVYGWWNCVNEQLPYVQDSNGHIMKEFRKLFLQTEAHFFED